MSYNIKKSIPSQSKVISTVDSYFQYAKEIIIDRSWMPLLQL
ncbi:10651_t:CDS:1, partial [Scutellospora calospora]